MLPRRLRLSRQAMSETRGLARAKSEHFSLVFGEAALPGAAVVVSKKVAKSAVARHLLKRRVLSVIRPYLKRSGTLIVYAQQGAAELPFSLLQDELISLLGSILPKPKI